AMVSKGDAAFGQKDYETAKGSYTNALGIKPTAEEVKSKIKNIDSILQKIAEDKKKEEDLKLALAAKEKAYADAIAKADKSFTAENYSDAKTSYSDALTIKPNDVYSTGRIAKIEEIIADKSKLQQTEAEFLAMVSKGDASFEQKNYEAAKGSYSNALGMRPNAEEVKTKIKNIDSILQKIAEDKKKEEVRLLALSEANEKAYTETIAKGKKQIDQKTYSDARVTFQQAKKLKPAELLPDEMIAKVDALIADNERELASARLKEEAYQKSIKEAQGNSFMEAMAKADKAFSENDFNTAKTGYQTAIAINGTDPIAKQKLGQTEAKLGELAKLTQAYNTAINAANKFVGDKQYKEAKEKYQEALQYLPDSDYPKRQVEKLDALLSQAATELQKEEAYASKVKEAESLLSAKDYISARSTFVQASEIKPSEPLPVNRIKEIDKLLADLALEEANKKASESGYLESIKRADEAFAAKEYTSARLSYSGALSVKPNEQYPKDQIAKIDGLLKELAAAEEKAKLLVLEETQRQAKEKAIKEQYDQAISEADKAFAAKLYPAAKTSYSNALSILPNEKYPKDQISKIDGLIASEEKNRVAVVTKEEVIAPAPKVNVPVYNAVETEKATVTRAQSYKAVNTYEEAISKADDSFGIKDYTVARFYYYKAMDLKSKEEYPKNQIELIRKLVDAELSSVDRSGYQQAITQADDAFKIQNYTVAKFFYNKAIGIKSWEKYPKDRVQEILALTNSLLSEREEKEYHDLIAKGDEAYAVKDISVARFYYNKAIAIKKDETYPRIKIKDIQKLIDQDTQDGRKLEYNKLIELADEALKSESFSIARFNYNKALNLKPEEKYPKDQLKLIKEKLDKQKK
ncbi:MAG TPA: hypothetical protein DCL77_02565, partial [Prolixibacteraceae bacterium]|nr:hypothetical protein [Prolixibacteraceae bacterium]